MDHAAENECSQTGPTSIHDWAHEVRASQDTLALLPSRGFETQGLVST